MRRETIARLRRLPEALVRLLRHPAMMVAGFAAGIWFLYEAENYWLSMPFAITVTALLVGLVFAVTRRIVFSYYTVLMVLALITTISFIKFWTKGFSLHFYDIVFVGQDTEVVKFLTSTYAMFIIPVVVFLLCLIVAAVILFRYDKKLNCRRGWMTASIVIPALLLPLAYPPEARVERYFYYLQGRHMTAFFVSLVDLAYLTADGKLEQRMTATEPQMPFAADIQCGDTSPDVFIVLSESQINPADFPQLAGSETLISGLEQANGPMQPLNVETFGGGTWITNLSLMTGLTATDFGWRSPYLTIELEGRVGGTLPELFAACGYRTIAMLPMKHSFVNEGAFLESIGFETVLDMDALGAPYFHMRDSFYFDAAERIVAEHRETDNRPLFLTIQTMFPHSPYEVRLEPDVAVEGEPFHDNSETAEYLRRLLIARQDLGAFVDRRKAEAATRQSIVVDYGDHQSFVTKAFVDETAGTDALSKPGSLAYRTFFTMRQFGPDGEQTYVTDTPVDIGLLGSRLLEFTGLVSSPMWRELARLDEACGGALFGCAMQDQADRHMRRRVDSGLLSLGRAEDSPQINSELRTTLAADSDIVIN